MRRRPGRTVSGKAASGSFALRTLTTNDSMCCQPSLADSTTIMYAGRSRQAETPDSTQTSTCTLWWSSLQTRPRSHHTMGWCRATPPDACFASRRLSGESPDSTQDIRRRGAVSNLFGAGCSSVHGQTSLTMPPSCNDDSLDTLLTALLHHIFRVNRGQAYMLPVLPQ